MGSKYAVKPHNGFFYDMIMLILRPYLWLKYRFKAPKDIPAMPDGPILLLGSHTGNLDFLFALAALRKKRFHAVVAAHFYRNKSLAWLLTLLRCIKKEQFRADVESIAKMRGVISIGESLLIYPEGEVNGTGRTSSAPRSIAKLAKLLKAPVYAVRTHGSYFTRTKWNPIQRRGKVETEIELVATSEELKQLDAEKLYQRIESKLYVDDYAWQKQRMIAFSGGKRAKGLEKLLYLCPRCGAESTTRTEYNDIFCTKCSNRGSMDEYGFLHAHDEGCIIPEIVADWVELERERLRADIAKPDFRLSAECSLQYHLDPRSTEHTDVGHGTVTLTRDAITYAGTAEGREVTYSFPIDNIYKFPFEMGEQFDIPNTMRTIGIRPDDYQQNEKFVLALPLIHEYMKKQRAQHKEAE